MELKNCTKNSPKVQFKWIPVKTASRTILPASKMAQMFMLFNSIKIA